MGKKWPFGKKEHQVGVYPICHLGKKSGSESKTNFLPSLKGGLLGKWSLNQVVSKPQAVKQVVSVGGRARQAHLLPSQGL